MSPVLVFFLVGAILTESGDDLGGLGRSGVVVREEVEDQVVQSKSLKVFQSWVEWCSVIGPIKS